MTWDFIKNCLPKEATGAVLVTGLGRQYVRVANQFVSFTELPQKLDSLLSMQIPVSFSFCTYKMDGAAVLRNVENMERCGGLFFDLDIGDGFFPNIEAAQAWANTTCLSIFGTTPALIMSGKGIHLFLPVEEGLAPYEYYYYHAALRALFLTKYGLPPATDAAAAPTMLIRVPGSINAKRGAISYLLQNIYGKISIASLRRNFGMCTPPLPRSKVKKKKTELGEPANLDHILAGCAQMRECWTGTEPAWRSGITVALRCENGKQRIHELSAQDERYNQTQTDRKIAYIEKTEERLGVEAGFPATCMEFFTHNRNGCDNCPLRGQLKSPVEIGRRPSLYIQSMDALPALYARPSLPIKPQRPALPKGVPVTPTSTGTPPLPIRKTGRPPLPTKKTVRPPLPIKRNCRPPLPIKRSTLSRPPLPIKHAALSRPPLPQKRKSLLEEIGCRYVPKNPQSAIKFLEVIAPVVENSPIESYMGLTGGLYEIVLSKNGSEKTPVFISPFTLDTLYAAEMPYGPTREKAPGIIVNIRRGTYIQKHNLTIYDRDMSRTEARPLLASYGVTIADDKKASRFLTYVRAKIEDSHDMKRRDGFDALGWANKTENPRFILGDTQLSVELQDGVRVPVVAPNHRHESEDMLDAVHSEGSREAWRKAFAILEEGDIELLFAAMASFGAPLMKLLGNQNLILHMFSTLSGVGKSAAQEVGAAIWGDPEVLIASQLGSPHGVTKTAFWSMASSLHNLPVFADEITRMKDEEVADFIYAMSSGVERRRADISGRARNHVGRWSTLFVTSANKSFVRQAMNDTSQRQEAVIYRILELQPTERKMADPDIRRTLRSVRYNYGHIGSDFARALVYHYKYVHDKAFDIERDLTTALRATQQERFWIAGCSAILTGALLTEECGIASPGMYDKLRDFVINILIPRARDSIVQINEDVADSTEQFMAELRPHTVVVRNQYKPAVLPMPNDPILTNRLGWASDMHGERLQKPYIIQTAAFGRPIYARMEYETGHLYVSPGWIREWTKRHGMDYDIFIYTLTSAYNASSMADDPAKHPNILLTRWISEADIIGKPTRALPLKMPRKDLDNFIKDKQNDESNALAATPPPAFPIKRPALPGKYRA